MSVYLTISPRKFLTLHANGDTVLMSPTHPFVHGRQGTQGMHHGTKRMLPYGSLYISNNASMTSLESLWIISSQVSLCKAIFKPLRTVLNSAPSSGVHSRLSIFEIEKLLEKFHRWLSNNRGFSFISL